MVKCPQKNVQFPVDLELEVIEQSEMRSYTVKSRQEVQFPVDLDGEALGFQVDSQGKVWVCVDGMCVMRVRGLKNVEITDLRSPKPDEEELE